MWRSSIIGRKEMSAEMVQTNRRRIGTDLRVRVRSCLDYRVETCV